jgi:NTP pyrophosphatase (non-canonical NTP hydrolase)
MRITEICKQSHKTAIEKGFWKNKNIPEKIMLIVTELAEAVEALRKGNRQSNGRYYYNNGKICIQKKKNDKFEWIKDTVEDELADAFIRLADLCEYMKIDIEWQIKNKMKYNKTREKMHGGKKF